MKKLFFATALFAIQLILSQNVLLNKVVKTNTNTDKFLYKIPQNQKNAEYLGEIEVQGYSNDDVEVFSKIYKKAKQIGANAFSYTPFETIEGKESKLDPFHYQLRLFYINLKDFPAEENTYYIISANENPQKIKINNKKLTINPRSFIRKKIEPESENEISVGKLLGSRIKLSEKKGQTVQYFSINSFNVKPDQSGTNGNLSVKSADIMLLEKSFANFLITIYDEQK